MIKCVGKVQQTEHVENFVSLLTLFIRWYCLNELYVVLSITTQKDDIYILAIALKDCDHTDTELLVIYRIMY